MNLQMGKDLKPKASYDYWKPYLYEKREKMKRYYSLLSSEADYAARVSDEETSPHEASHKCNLCGKSFSSGKALGGHSRSHFQASKKKISNNSKEGTSVNNNSSLFNDDDDDDIRYNDEKKDHICYICKKNFPTKNALYGHMRSHPNRVCKGISPPSNHHQIQIHNLSYKNKNGYNSASTSLNSNSSMEDNKEDQEDDCVAPKGYSDIDISNSPLPKGKRGRKCSESYEAAITLLQLSGNTKYLCSAVSINKFETPKSFVELASMKKKRELGESSSSGKEHPIKKIKFVFGGSLKLGNKSDVFGTSENVFDDSHMFNKGNGLCESDNNKVKETSLVVEPSEPAGPKSLEIDLNEPCVMED